MELFKILGRIAIDGADEAKKDIDNVSDSAEKSESKLAKFGNTVSKLGTSVLKGTAVALGAVSTAIVAVGTNAVKYNATMEQYSTSFEVMTGSAEKATATMEKLKDLGASTPFEFEDLASATQLLMNYGFTADGAIDSMMMLGDIAQGDADKMNRVAAAYGQMSSAGKVSLEDVKQMIEAGFNPLQEISESTGESMESLYDRISKGTISVDEITASMQRSTSEGGKYFQSMEKQSKTVAGQFSTLKDNFNQMTGQIFNGVSQMIGSKALPVLIGWVGELTTAFEEEGIDGFINALGEILGEGLAYITDALPEVAEMGFNILCSLLDGITKNKDKISTAVVTLVTTFTTGISKFLVKFADTGCQIITSLVSGISEELPLLIQTIIDLALQLVDVWLENSTLFLEAGLQFIVSLAEGLLVALPDLLSKLPEIVKKMVSTLLANIGLLIQAGVQLLTALVDNLPLIIDTIVEVLPQIITAIISALTSENGLAQVISAGVTLLTAIISNLPLIISTIIGAIPEIISGIFGAFTSDEALESMKEAGIEIIYSLLEGLQSVWDEITGWATDAMDWLADKFGIGEPTGNFLSKINSFGKSSGIFETARTNAGVKTRTVGKYASGGVVPKGQIAYLEGDGAEAVVPLDQNRKWISKVASDMNDEIGGNTVASNKDIQDLNNTLNTLIHNLPEMLAYAMTNVKVDLDRRELGRLVRQVNA